MPSETPRPIRAGAIANAGRPILPPDLIAIDEHPPDRKPPSRRKRPAALLLHRLGKPEVVRGV
jgi:hypothetical protein